MCAMQIITMDIESIWLFILIRFALRHALHPPVYLAEEVQTNK